MADALCDRHDDDRNRRAHLDRRAPARGRQVHGQDQLGRWSGDRGVAGAVGNSRHFAQRHHHHDRAFSRPEPRDGGAIFLLAFNTGDCSGGPQEALGHSQRRRLSPRHARSLCPWRGSERRVGRGGDRLLSPLPPPPQPDALRLLPHHFWHNSNRSRCIFPLQRGMKILGPTRFHRLNEAGGLVFLFAGIFFILSLISFHPQDPSWNTASGVVRAHNLTGFAGSYTSDLCFQLLGLGAFGIPALLWMLAWKWVRSQSIQAPWVKIFGSLLLFLSACTALSIGPELRPWDGAFSAGGILGVLIADSLISSLNLTGATLLTSFCLIVSLYLISTFSMAATAQRFAGPLTYVRKINARWADWRARRQQLAMEKAEGRAAERAKARAEKDAARAAKAAMKGASPAPPPTIVEPREAPGQPEAASVQPEPVEEPEIPIR